MNKIGLNDYAVNVTICIVVHENDPSLNDTLESITRQNLSPKEVSILFMGSEIPMSFKQELAAYKSKLLPIRLRFKKLESINYGEAGRVGILSSRCKYVAFLAPGSIAPRTWLESLYAGFGRNEDAEEFSAPLFAVGGGIRPPRGRSSIDDALNLMFMCKWGHTDYKNVRRIVEDLEVDYLPCDNIMLDRNLVLESGNFSDQFVGQGAGVELCHRARRAGHRIVLIGGAHVIQRMARNWAHWSQRMYTRGLGIALMNKVHGLKNSVSAWVSFLFLASFLVSALGAPFNGYFALFPVWYLVSLFCLSLAQSISFKKPRLMLALYGLYLTTHFSFCLGMVRGYLDHLWAKQELKEAPDGYEART